MVGLSATARAQSLTVHELIDAHEACLDQCADTPAGTDENCERGCPPLSAFAVRVQNEDNLVHQYQRCVRDCPARVGDPSCLLVCRARNSRGYRLARDASSERNPACGPEAEQATAVHKIAEQAALIRLREAWARAAQVRPASSDAEGIPRSSISRFKRELLRLQRSTPAQASHLRRAIITQERELRAICNRLRIFPNQPLYSAILQAIADFRRESYWPIAQGRCTATAGASVASNRIKPIETTRASKATDEGQGNDEPLASRADEFTP